MRRGLHRCWIASALLLLANATPAAGQLPRIGVDPRIEFFAIAWKLAGASEYNQNRFKPYQEDIARSFGSFRNHPVMPRIRAVRDSAGLEFSTVMDVAINVTAPPALEQRAPFEKSSGLTPATSRLLVDLRAFAAESRFDAFVEAHKALYDSATARMKRLVTENADLTWFGRFFGTEPGEDFIVVPLLANSGTNFGPRTKSVNGRREVYAILGHERDDAQGFPIYNVQTVGTLVHEFAHSWANDLGDERRAEFERSAPRVFDVVRDAMVEQAYGDWMGMVNESLVRATVGQYYVEQGNQADYERYLADQTARGWYWVGDLVKMMGAYEGDRGTYPYFSLFMPRIVSYFDALPERVGAMKSAYDATRPRVVSVSLANDATGVDPSVSEILVRFDRAMADDAFAVRAVAGRNDRMPTVTARELDAKGTTLRLGVRLEPNRSYEFQLNGAAGQGFRTREGDIPLAPYILRFATSGGD
jgi:hypothetical protein